MSQRQVPNTHAGVPTQGVVDPKQEWRGTTESSHASGRLPTILLRSLHFVISAAILVGLSYVLGQFILTKGSLGNDSHLHIAYSWWLDYFFPRIPHWYPSQGGGESILHGYPILAHLLVVLIHRVSGLTVTDSFFIVSFGVFPLTAITTYLFAWSVSRSQTMGLLAGIFYLICPVTWVWSFDWGFFPQSVAIVFLPLLLLTIDRLREDMEGGNARKQVSWMASFIGLLSIIWLTHPMVAASGLVGAALWIAFGVPLAEKGSRRAVLSRGVRVLGSLGLVTAVLLAFYLVPFIRYGQVANSEGLNNPAPNQLHQLPIPQVFGVGPIDPTDLWHRARLPLVVTAFALLGGGLAIRRSRKMLALFLASATGAIWAVSPALVNLAMMLNPLVYQFVNFRSLLVLLNVTAPVLAAYGAASIGSLISSPVAFLRPYRSGQAFASPYYPNRAWTRALGSLVSVVVAAFCIFWMGQLYSVKPDSLMYGPTWHGLPLNDIWGNGAVAPDIASILDQLRLSNWPVPALPGSPPGWDDTLRLGSQLPDSRPLRIDISPYLGRSAMDFTTYTSTSQLNSYTFQISLIHSMWGYQQNVFYSHEPGNAEYGNPVSLNNVAKWFGTQYVFLNSGQDPVEMYISAGWDRTYSEGALEIWYDAEAPEMATVSSRPVVLVIGKPETDAYMSIFRLANDGMLPYDDAFLVQGNSRVDSYSLEELERFDALLLYGYDYGNGAKAWGMLAEYVKSGGRLFIDTGWQYRIPEWEFDVAPEVLPVARLSWTNYGKATDYQIQASDIGGDIDTTRFAPLIWESDPWSVSGATLADIRDWGRVVLSAAGRPLVVAGQLGEGRVVWSGMNLVAHAWDNRNQEEIGLLHNLLAWLIQDKAGGDSPVVVTSNFPDRILFGLSVSNPGETWLYWREAFYSNWHAYLTQGSQVHELPIYRSGPGFMLMPVEGVSGGAHVDLVWEPPLVERMATGLSAAMVVALSVFLFDALFLGGWLQRRTVSRLRRAKTVRRSRGSVQWLDGFEEEANRDWSESRDEHGFKDEPAKSPFSATTSRDMVAPEEVDLGDRTDVAAVWEKYVESQKSSAVEDERARDVIEWWRRSRQHDTRD